MASVSLKNITKQFGTQTVIQDVSVDVPDGKFCVLVGPSGSGKSTLLRIIAGLEEVSAGEVWIGDRDVTLLPPKARDIAMVFQSYALYPQLNVKDNMAFGLMLAKRPKVEIEQKIAAVAQKLGLEALLERYPKQLSGGQRQRVAMGRAIVRDPHVFLFDEPLSNLDAALRTQVRAEIRELQHSLKTTSIYVTHDQIEAMTMGDTIVVLREGRVEQIGAPLDVYDNPVNVFVAGFIGSPAINLLNGHCRRRDGKNYIELPEGVFLPLPEGVDVKEGQSIVYGVRPEDLKIVSATESDALAARVSVVEHTGADTLLLCKTTAGALSVVQKQRLHAKVGETLQLQPNVACVHLFDPDSGRRVPSLVKIQQVKTSA